MTGLLLIAAGLLHIAALRLEWSWFMEWYQCRQMRENWGEPFFAFYTYAASALCIGAGMYMMLKPATA